MNLFKFFGCFFKWTTKHFKNCFDFAHNLTKGKHGTNSLSRPCADPFQNSECVIFFHCCLNMSSQCSNINFIILQWHWNTQFHFSIVINNGKTSTQSWVYSYVVHFDSISSICFFKYVIYSLSFSSSALWRSLEMFISTCASSSLSYRLAIFDSWSTICRSLI